MRASLAGALAVLLIGCSAVLGGSLGAHGAPSDLPVADLLLVGFSGTELADNDEIRALICDVRAGGAILYERDVASRAARNIVSPAQVARLTADLQRLARRCAGRPLLIATDNEGGLVMRQSFRAGYPPAPSHQELGEAGDPIRTELEARHMARMMRAAGINWNLAPVVDVAVNPTNPAVVTLARAFSSDPEEVIVHARAYITGMHAQGILTTLKHFPGHGSSRVDSHLGFTDVTDTADPDVEMRPYRALIQAGLADSVMTAHVFNRRLDPRHPATLSRPTIQGLLRGGLGYAGLVVSDDLLMGAITQHYGLEEAAVLTLQAGVDVLLISQNTAGRDRRAAARVVAAIRQALADGRLTRAALETSLRRIQAFRARIAPPASSER